MADAEAVTAGLPRGQVSWIGLVLNERGLDRAIAAGMDEVNVVVVATDTFSRAQPGRVDADAIAAWPRRPGGRRRRAAHHGDRRGRFRLPLRGRGPPEPSARPVALPASGPDELALADTIGVGCPPRSKHSPTCRRAAPGNPAALALPQHPQHRLRQRLHRRASGVPAADASVGGIGGCPFAPAATGNIATEDLLYLLHRSGDPRPASTPSW